MTLDYDNRGLQNAVRVMWGQSFKSDELTNHIDETSVEVYASRSNNPRLANTNINVNSTPETGYIEYVAYPPETNKPDYDLRDYELTFKDPAKYNEAVKNGYFATTPFYSNEYVFQRETVLDKDDIMYCYGDTPKHLCLFAWKVVFKTDALSEDSLQRESTPSGPHGSLEEIFFPVYGKTAGITYNSNNSEATG